MVFKTKKVSVEKLGKEKREIEDYGYPRWQKFVKDRLLTITEGGYVLHFDRNMNLLLSWYGVYWGYRIKFSKSFNFISISSPYNYIHKYNPITNSYEIVNVPSSVHIGTEALGENYYWRMSSALPTKLEVYDLNGNLIREIDLSNVPDIQPFTHSFTNKDGSTFYGWSYYSPNYLIKVNVDGTYEVKDISHISPNWVDVVETDNDAKKVFIVFNNRSFGIFDTDTLEFEELVYAEDLYSVYCGVSKNLKYAIASVEKGMIKIFDLERKTSTTREVLFIPQYAKPAFPKITNDGKGYVVFHELTDILLIEFRRFQDNRLVDTDFTLYDYPYSVDVVETVI